MKIGRTGEFNLEIEVSDENNIRCGENCPHLNDCRSGGNRIAKCSLFGNEFLSWFFNDEVLNSQPRRCDGCLMKFGTVCLSAL